MYLKATISSLTIIKSMDYGGGGQVVSNLNLATVLFQFESHWLVLLQSIKFSMKREANVCHRTKQVSKQAGFVNFYLFTIPITA